MNKKIFHYPITIKETDLDSFGHVNNAVYLTLYEDARWEVVTQNGYGLKKIRETGIAPVILEIKLNFLKELHARDAIIIETQLISYEKNTGIIAQRILRNSEVCSTAEITIALFNLKERRLIPPTKEWLQAIGAEV